MEMDKVKSQNRGEVVYRYYVFCRLIFQWALIEVRWGREVTERAKTKESVQRLEEDCSVCF